MNQLLNSYIKNEHLLSQGFLILDFKIPEIIQQKLIERDFYFIDQFFLEIERPNGLLYNFLSNYLTFDSLEHIIAIRSAPFDDEGIWHDDGSRLLGYSLSLNLNPPMIEGGELLLRKKSNSITEWKEHSISPLLYGQIVIFLTGLFGLEHKVCQVTKSERIVIAGWASHQNIK
jgi:hypothetical protein